jgi:hypothetical protein
MIILNGLYYNEKTIVKQFGWQIKYDPNKSIELYLNGKNKFKGTCNNMSLDENTIKNLLLSFIRNLEITEKFIIQLGWEFNPLEFSNDDSSWKYLSKYYKFSLDELDKYKDKIGWYEYITRPNHLKLSDKILTYLINDHPIRKVKISTLIKWLKDISPSIINKYKGQLEFAKIVKEVDMSNNIEYFVKNKIIKFKNIYDFILFYKCQQLTKNDINYLMEKIKKFKWYTVEAYRYQQEIYNYRTILVPKNDNFYEKKTISFFYYSNKSILQDMGIFNIEN